MQLQEHDPEHELGERQPTVSVLQYIDHSLVRNEKGLEGQEKRTRGQNSRQLLVATELPIHHRLFTRFCNVQAWGYVTRLVLG